MQWSDSGGFRLSRYHASRIKLYTLAAIPALGVQLPSIFLSHNSADKPFVRRLADRLMQSGVTVWLDEVALQIGDSLIDKISEAITRVDFVAAVISRHSIKSAWVQKELSLAVAKEIKGKRVVILPILIDNCKAPKSLADKLYADFRESERFDQECDKLLRAIGVNISREHFPDGMWIEWTAEGPRVVGNGVILSPTEANALLDRWKEWLPRFIEQERQKRGKNNKTVGEAASILAVIRACFETFHRVPGEEEMKEGKTELSRKFDLLFKFVVNMSVNAISEEPE